MPHPASGYMPDGSSATDPHKDRRASRRGWHSDRASKNHRRTCSCRRQYRAAALFCSAYAGLSGPRPSSSASPGTPRPCRRGLAMTERMCAIDIEGSGASPPEIVELAIAEMHGFDLTGRSRHWHVKPQGRISPLASRIHGIRASDVANAPTMAEIANDVLMWLESSPIVGHNVSVDYTILKRELVDWRPRAAIDTLWIARRLLPKEERYGLARLGNILGLDVLAAQRTGGSAHSALYDATLAAQLLRHLLGPLSDGKRRAIMLSADILRERQISFLS